MIWIFILVVLGVSSLFFFGRYSVWIVVLSMGLKVAFLALAGIGVFFLIHKLFKWQQEKKSYQSGREPKTENTGVENN